MTEDLQQICEAVVEAWKREFKPPEFSGYLTNALDFNVEEISKQAAAAWLAAEAVKKLESDGMRERLDAALSEQLGRDLDRMVAVAIEKAVERGLERAKVRIEGAVKKVVRTAVDVRFEQLVEAAAISVDEALAVVIEDMHKRKKTPTAP